MRFMNGEEVELNRDNVTIFDVGVAAARKLKVFSPEITVVSRDGSNLTILDKEFGLPLDVDLPDTVWVISNIQEDKSQIFWMRTLLGHAEAKDIKGAKRALSELSHFSRGECLRGSSARGSQRAVAFLLKSGIDVNTANRNGISPLFYASVFGRDKIIRLLLAARANVNHVDNRGKSSLWFASDRGHLESVQLLLDAGARGRCDGNYPY